MVSLGVGVYQPTNKLTKLETPTFLMQIKAIKELTKRETANQPMLLNIFIHNINKGNSYDHKRKSENEQDNNKEFLVTRKCTNSVTSNFQRHEKYNLLGYIKLGNRLQDSKEKLVEMLQKTCELN